MSVTVSRARVSRARLGSLARLPWRWRTYRNILYLLVSFPLGLAYLVVVLTGLALGVGTVVIGIGIPILLATVAGLWALGAFERHLAVWWLGADIAPIPRPRVAGRSVWSSLKAYLADQATWTNLAYILAKFPLGLIAFGLALAALAGTAHLVATPFPYLLDWARYGPAAAGVPPSALLWSVAGLALGLGSLYLLNGLALLAAQFARLMLGASDIAVRLSATTAIAAREQAKAARAEQSRRELIVNVSHELRTPTASIRGHVESLLMTLDAHPDAAPPPAELRAYLGIIQRETERLGTLVDELLPLARAEAGELRLDIVPIVAGEVVEEVFQTIAPLARRERAITLVRETPAGMPLVLADRARLVQVLTNLVRNAITYTPNGGIVSIALAPASAGFVALTVADTGIGIPADDLGRVFERFYRTDASRARSSGGFGLGLAIVRDLVTAMGGSVKASSVVGQGSEFTVLLRVAGAGPDRPGAA